MSLPFIIHYIFTFKKIFALFLHYNGKTYKIKINALGKKDSVTINRSSIQVIRAKYCLIQ